MLVSVGLLSRNNNEVRGERLGTMYKNLTLL